MARRVVSIAFPADPQLRGPLDFGTAVRAARTGRGLSLEQAALLVGVAKQTLQDLELGTASVGLELALRVARELGVAVFAVPAARGEAVSRCITALRDGEGEDE